MLVAKPNQQSFLSLLPSNTPICYFIIPLLWLVFTFEFGLESLSVNLAEILCYISRNCLPRLVSQFGLIGWYCRSFCSFLLLCSTLNHICLCVKLPESLCIHMSHKFKSAFPWCMYFSLVLKQSWTQTSQQQMLYILYYTCGLSRLQITSDSTALNNIPSFVKDLKCSSSDFFFMVCLYMYFNFYPTIIFSIN